MKKNLKGMTLAEVIIALAIFTVIALMIAIVFSSSALMKKQTARMNNKINNQVHLFSKSGTTLNDNNLDRKINFDFGASGDTDINIKIIELEKNDTAKQQDSRATIRYFNIRP